MPNHKILMPVVILCVICLVTTGLLSLTYELTREERDRQSEAAANANRLALFPGAVAFQAIVQPDSLPDGLLEATRAEAADGALLGFLIVGVKRGYGGPVPVMVAIDPDHQIVGVRVLSNDETPGLGKKVEQGMFLKQFIGHSVDKLFTLKMDSAPQQQVDAVSGATISSRAVTEAVNIAVRYFKSMNRGAQ